MKHWLTIPTAVSLLVWMFACPAAVHAQDPETEAPPKPAAKAYPPIDLGDDQETDQGPIALQPDDRPLTGFQDWTVGTATEKHSYWIPGVSYTNFIESNALAQGGGNSWNSTSYILGNLSLLQNWGTAQLSLNYSGGEAISTDSAIGTGQTHQFSAFQTFNWGRWRVTVLDQFAYLRQAQFGFGAGSGIAIPGVGGLLAPSLPGLQTGLTPSQSAFTQVGPETSNSFGTQFNYALTPRSSLTIGGVFSILRFTEPGSIESNDVVLYAGYNHQVSRTDTLGMTYRFTAYEFLDSPQAIGVHVIQAAYGKKITGRLALKLSGGPEITSFRVPPGVGTGTQFIDGTGSASLSYAFSAGSVSLSYNHGANNGSGLLFGATSDQVIGSANRKLTRAWRGNVSLGYTRNASLAGSSANTNPNLTYNTVYIGAGLERSFNRATDLTLNYTANIQTSNTAVCAGANCGTDFTSHVITVGLKWRSRPFVLH
jgi:hypothetical protein